MLKLDNHKLNNQNKMLEQSSKVLARSFIENNIPLRNFDSLKFKTRLKEINLNIKTSKTERKNLFHVYEDNLQKLKFKYLTKNLVLIADSSKINNVNHTIIVIADLNDTRKFDY